MMLRPSSAGPWPPWRIVRAAGRLLTAAIHLLYGIAIVAFRWPFLDEGARQASVARWSRRMLRCLGLALAVRGQPRPGTALVVANHVSWLDIAALLSVLPGARFVAHAGLRRWPLLGWLSTAVGTIFIERERKRDALRVVHQVAQALALGQQVAVFPEGTNGGGPIPLPFHANLLQAAIAGGAPLQPVALRYAEPGRRFSPSVVWLGETTLLGSLWAVANAHALCVRVTLLPAQDTRHAERRVLAQHVRAQIATALAQDEASPG